jgi:hypothetical protein
MIAVYITTENMTAATHAEGRKRLEEAGALEDAMKVHAVFGDDGSLQVFDIWESQQAFDAFLEQLRPILDDLGVKLSAPPMIMPVVDLMQQG